MMQLPIWVFVTIIILAIPGTFLTTALLVFAIKSFVSWLFDLGDLNDLEDDEV